MNKIMHFHCCKCGSSDIRCNTFVHVCADCGKIQTSGLNYDTLWNFIEGKNGKKKNKNFLHSIGLILKVLRDAFVKREVCDNCGKKITDQNQKTGVIISGKEICSDCWADIFD
jgi:hypothetical protein